jgi:hypothetical protein
MRKTKKAHLWIGLICSILILMESITGLLMNEPWLIGQSQGEGRGNFQQAQMNQDSNSSTSGINQQNQMNQDNTSTSGTNQQNLMNGQSQPMSQNQANNQTQNQASNNSNSQFPGPGGFSGKPMGDGTGTSGSLMGIIKGLHEGRIGTTNIKWLIDLTAIAMIFLTGSGVFLSIKILSAEKRKQKRKVKEAAVN